MLTTQNLPILPCSFADIIRQTSAVREEREVLL